MIDADELHEGGSGRSANTDALKTAARTRVIESAVHQSDEDEIELTDE